MRDVKCADCEWYRDEWCEKVVDSPYPDWVRDCEYYREREYVKVVRCKDCKFFEEHEHYGSMGESAYTCMNNMGGWIHPKGFCSHGERREDGKEI